MFRLRRRPPVCPNGRIPDGQRVYAIGDVHGRVDLLNVLLAKIQADVEKLPAARIQLILLGDLIDRGPDSAAVVERARQLAEASDGVSVLLGNHEEVFLLALGGEIPAMRLFARIGGLATLVSYGLSEDQIAAADYNDLIRLAIDAVPREHLEFMGTFKDLITIGDYAFVHAGVRPDIPLDRQRTEDLRWIRKDFLDSPGPFDRIIVHGHTISENVEERPFRIGVDTGAYVTGKLTALALEGDRRWYLST
ncbi:metallophosphoesterase [Sphingomonas asaccharolytica]|uniref:metallophosphoesterase n=1 Tax=Sphingomonas asaccharolytica TaxID=40681 RepID=UPI00082CBAD9|nr:metallophosphoesterase [Sphingomonas asaccharolytica]